MTSRLRLQLYGADTAPDLDLDLDFNDAPEQLGRNTLDVDQLLDEVLGTDLDRPTCSQRPITDDLDLMEPFGEDRPRRSIEDQVNDLLDPFGDELPHGSLSSEEIAAHPDWADRAGLGGLTRPSGIPQTAEVKIPSRAKALACEDWPLLQQGCNYRVVRVTPAGTHAVTYWHTLDFAFKELAEAPFHCWVTVGDRLGREFAYRRPVGDLS